MGYRSRRLGLVLSLAVGMGTSAALASPTSGREQRRAPIQSNNPQGPEIDVAFVLDTTSSMGGLIEGAKEKIWSIASNIARGQPRPHLKIALVAYRDVGDDYVAKHEDFTDDLDSVYAHLRALRAEGGGDTPEHVGRGLGEAVSRLSWSKDEKALKTMFLVGDAPPADRHDDWNYRTWAKAAARKGIVVNAVRCGSDMDTERAWKEIAGYSRGSYASIEENGGVVAMVTPYDADLGHVNAEIARSTVFVGDKRAREESHRGADGVASMAPEAAASRASYLTAVGGKGASAAPKASAGAVDAVAEPEVAANASKKELPDDLAELTPTERRDKLEGMKKKRTALDAEAQRLTVAREQWLASHAKADKDDSFDAKVMGAIKTEAAKSGVKY